MSAQIQPYRWSDKPVAAKQAIFMVLIGLLVLFLFFRFKSKFQSAPENHAFTQPGHDHNNKNQTAQELAKSGSVAPGGMSIHSRFQAKGGSGSAPAHDHNKNVIQERPLFDGKTATLDVSLDQSISSSSGDPSAAASVIAIIPGEVSPSDATGMQSAKLQGQFQSNFDSKRMLIQFRELLTADGRRYAVSGISMDDDGQSIGVPADYSSGMGMRILGATLGTVINTAEIVGTSRVIENGAGQDALMASQLNQAVTTSAQGATATISDEATRDMKNQRPSMSLSAGTRFRVKVHQVVQNGGSS